MSSDEHDRFTVEEYRADRRRVIDHAIRTGRAVIVRPDGSALVVISIPPADDAAV